MRVLDITIQKLYQVWSGIMSEEVKRTFSRFNEISVQFSNDELLPVVHWLDDVISERVDDRASTVGPIPICSVFIRETVGDVLCRLIAACTNDKRLGFEGVSTNGRLPVARVIRLGIFRTLCPRTSYRLSAFRSTCLATSLHEFLPLDTPSMPG